MLSPDETAVSHHSASLTWRRYMAEALFQKVIILLPFWRIFDLDFGFTNVACKPVAPKETPIKKALLRRSAIRRG
jgi:hypothetical protein